MRTVLALWVLSPVLLLVGCQPVTYQVRIINNAGFTTDFAIDSNDSTALTFVQDLASGQARTVSHTGESFLIGTDPVTISSGTVVGNDITPIDAQCFVVATANDLVTVTKAPNGELTCTVTAGRSAAATSKDKSARKER